MTAAIGGSIRINQIVSDTTHLTQDSDLNKLFIRIFSDDLYSHAKGVIKSPDSVTFLLFLREKKEKLIAFAITEKRKKYLEVCFLGVKANKRRGGYATQLMTKVFELALKEKKPVEIE